MKNFYLKSLKDILFGNFYKTDLKYYRIENIWLSISTWIAIILIVSVIILKIF